MATPCVDFINMRLLKQRYGFCKEVVIMSRTLIMISIVFLFALAVSSAAAADDWTTNGNAICVTPEQQRKPQIVSDDAGGSIIVWEDSRNGNYDIYAQRVDDMGNVLWADGGIAICTYSESQRYPDVAPDGSGEAFIVWGDYRSEWTEDIYAQRINAAGEVQWTADGIAVCTAEDYQYDPSVLYDGTGGAIFLWDDFRSLESYDVYAQRVDGSGVIQWTIDGIAVCAATGSQYHTDTIADGSGGLIVVWSDYRSGSADINVYAQWIDNLGTAQWTPDGVGVSTGAGSQKDPEMASDGLGGTIIGWVDYRDNVSDIYAQRIDVTGNPQWTANGIPVCTATGYQTHVRAVPDGSGGAIFSWMDARDVGQDIYAQRTDGSGTLLWSANGIVISSAQNDQTEPFMLPDEAGGAIVVWQDMRSGSANDIYGQHINGSGGVDWIADGVAITTAVNGQSHPAIAPDGAGGAIAVWEDLRDGNTDVYAQRVMNTGHVGGPIPTLILVQDVPYDQGGVIQLMWLPSPFDVSPNTDITHYTVWRRLSTEPEYTWESIENVTAQNLVAYLIAVQSPIDSTGTDTGWQYFKVSAHTAVPSVFYETAIDSGYSVDNLPPAVPQDFAVAYNTGGGNQLSWDVSADGDFDHFTVYRGATADFSPTPGYIVATTTAIFWTDPDHDDPMVHYKISASDITGNESVPTPPSTATGIIGQTSRGAFTLHDAVPNPFNPTTRIEFDVARQGFVSLRIYDALGRHVRTLVNDNLPPGPHQRTWSGTNDTGQRVATGVYFYKMTAGTFTQTRRVVLLK